MAETRRWEVFALLRRVKVLTWDRRMASLGTFFAARVEEGERARRVRRAG